MKVYQRTKKSDGEYAVTQADRENVLSHNNVVFWFSGLLLTERKTHYLNNELPFLEDALEDKSNSANIFAVAYKKAKKNERSLKRANDKENYSNREAWAFAEQYLLPMIHAHKQVTLVGTVTEHRS